LTIQEYLEALYKKLKKHNDDEISNFDIFCIMKNTDSLNLDCLLDFNYHFLIINKNDEIKN
jgi:hypothetical protein